MFTRRDARTALSKEHAAEVARLAVGRINNYCVKAARLELGRADFSEAERARLTNCFLRHLGAFAVVSPVALQTLSDLADSFHRPAE